MRLGILPLGPVPDDLGLAALADALRARDVDVVAPAETLQGALAVSKEAERLQRADCDGVLVVVPPGPTSNDLISTKPYTTSALALRLPGTPLLLVGTPSPALFDAAGGFEEVGGVWYDRLLLGAGGLPAEQAHVEAWLKENERRERQRGLEAAQKLYGQRLALVGDAPTGAAFDAAQWAGQFGVSLELYAFQERIESADAYSATALASSLVGLADGIALGDNVPPGWMDELISAAGRGELPSIYDVRGDLNATLTAHLLGLVSQQRAETVPLDDLAKAPNGTAARITRHRRRFRCLLWRTAVPGRAAPVPPGVYPLAAAGTVYVVPGEHVGAMRAACHALDIDAVVLRDA